MVESVDIVLVLGSRGDLWDKWDVRPVVLDLPRPTRLGKEHQKNQPLSLNSKRFYVHKTSSLSFTSMCFSILLCLVVNPVGLGPKVYGKVRNKDSYIRTGVNFLRESSGSPGPCGVTKTSGPYKNISIPLWFCSDVFTTIDDYT